MEKLAEKTKRCIAFCTKPRTLFSCWANRRRKFFCCTNKKSILLPGRLVSRQRREGGGERCDRAKSVSSSKTPLGKRTEEEKKMVATENKLFSPPLRPPLFISQVPKMTTGKPYCLGLRKRLLERLQSDEDLSMRDVARIYTVSPSFIVKLAQQYNPEEGHRTLKTINSV